MIISLSSFWEASSLMWSQDGDILSNNKFIQNPCFINLYKFEDNFNKLMRNRSVKHEENTKDPHLLFKVSRSSLSYSNLPNGPLPKQSGVIKKKNKFQQNSINSSQSFTYLSKHLYSHNQKKQKETDCSKILGQISNKKLLYQMEELKKPVTQQAISIVHQALDKERSNVPDQPLRKNYDYGIRNCRSENKLIKKYNYLDSQQRSCIRQIDYIQPCGNAKQSQKLRSKSSTGNRFNYELSAKPSNPEYQTDKRETNRKYNYNTHENSHESSRSPYHSLSRKPYGSYSQQRLNQNSYPIKKTSQQTTRPIKTSEFTLNNEQQNTQLKQQVAQEIIRNEKYQKDRIQQHQRSQKHRNNLLIIHDHEDLDTSRIDKINEKLNKYINKNMKFFKQ